MDCVRSASLSKAIKATEKVLKKAMIYKTSHGVNLELPREMAFMAFGRLGTVPQTTFCNCEKLHFTD